MGSLTLKGFGPGDLALMGVQLVDPSPKGPQPLGFAPMGVRPWGPPPWGHSALGTPTLRTVTLGTSPRWVSSPGDQCPSLLSLLPLSTPKTPWVLVGHPSATPLSLCQGHPWGQRAPTSATRGGDLPGVPTLGPHCPLWAQGSSDPKDLWLPEDVWPQNQLDNANGMRVTVP